MTVNEIITHYKKGGMIIVTDDEDRENEGDLMISARCAEASHIAFMASRGRGLVCMPIAGSIAERLNLTLMEKESLCPYGTAFTVSVDAAEGTMTGISAQDRLRTIRTILNTHSTGADLIKPGHLFPLIAAEGGLKERQGHTEAAVELASLAGHEPAGIICEIMNDDGTMKRGPELEDFSIEHNLPILSIKKLKDYLEETSHIMTPLPTVYGDFLLYHYDSGISEMMPHLALVHKDADRGKTVTVRLHSECMTGDLFGSLRCDCGDQLKKSMEILNREKGILLYMRQEGRGIGLVRKMEAYRLQDSGSDTVDANIRLGFMPDERSYSEAAYILKSLGVYSIELLTNNPEKIRSLNNEGIHVAARRSIEIAPGRHNSVYMHTKKERMGHILQLKEIQ